jgi:hypothetical protein
MSQSANTTHRGVSATGDDEQPAMPVRILSWKSIRKGAALGVCDVLIGKALEVHGIWVLHSHGTCWVILTPRGKLDYATVIKRADRISAARFKHSVLRAIAEAYGPEVLQPGGLP